MPPISPNGGRFTVSCWGFKAVKINLVWKNMFSKSSCHRHLADLTLWGSSRKTLEVDPALFFGGAGFSHYESVMSQGCQPEIWVNC